MSAREMEDRAYVDGRNEGRRDERARIRRELLEAMDELRQEPAPGDTCLFWMKPSDVLAALDRICGTEEG